jgi:hypothetical protein
LSVLASAVTSALRGNQRPGLLHLPDGTDAYVDDALYLLGEWGFTYDDAQRFVIASSLRELPDGRWAAKEVGVEEPRQNGKGEKIEGRECLGLFYLQERKLIHSAHEFATASEALDRMDDRIGQNPKLKQRVKTVKRSHGEEGVYLKDGRSLRYRTRTKGGGRGFGADFLGMDEAMYIAEAFLGALMPVISARPNPQMWYMGSAVDQETMDNGIVFARLRQRALDHKPGRMAYFGWSAAYENGEVLWETPADVPEEAACDPVVIARANPALGIRIELEHVLETELPAMDHATFCVERLGVGNWPAPGSQNSDIRIEDWRALTDRESTALDPVCFAFDVKPDRSAAAIGVAGARSDGCWHLEIVEHRAGTEWVAGRLAELTRAHSSLEVPVDKGSPAGALIPALEQMGVAVNVIGAGEQAQACGAFVDAVRQARVRHRGSPELMAKLDSAIKGAAKRTLGEAWAWSRKSSDVDISPLVSVTLAFWGITKIGTGAGGFEW